MHTPHAGIFLHRIGIDVLEKLMEKRELNYHMLTKLFEMYSKHIRCGTECPPSDYVFEKCSDNFNKHVNVTLSSSDREFLFMDGIRNAFDLYISPYRRSTRCAIARKPYTSSEISEFTDVASRFSRQL